MITADGGLELYGIGPTRPAAHRLRVLAGPPGAKATGVTLSGGTSPRACATWSDSDDTWLRCYSAPSYQPEDMETGDVELDEVGLSVSGQSLAWTKGARVTGLPEDATDVVAQP